LPERAFGEAQEFGSMNFKRNDSLRKLIDKASKSSKYGEVYFIRPAALSLPVICA
jgi:hypothetical protein